MDPKPAQNKFPAAYKSLATISAYIRLSRKIAADGGLTKIRPADGLNLAKDNIYSQFWLFQQFSVVCATYGKL